MNPQIVSPRIEEQLALLRALGWWGVVACGLLFAGVAVADVIVPDHNWIADTISDLGAGRYEFIVDIGLYAYASGLIALALLAAHVHLGGAEWSFGTGGLAVLGLIVFLVGARNEYGDGDREGIVIHIYLVYGLGLLFALVPFAMARGAMRAGRRYGVALLPLGALWIAAAPVFFFLPDDVDGAYERALGLISSGIMLTLAHLFIARARGLGFDLGSDLGSE